MQALSFKLIWGDLWLGNSTVGADGSINLGVGPSTELINSGMGNQIAANNALGQAVNMGHGQSAVNYSPYATQAMDKSLADPLSGRY